MKDSTTRHRGDNLKWEFVFDATPQEAERALEEVIAVVMRFGEEHGFFEEPDSS